MGQNKPQWQIDAEKLIAEFNKTDISKRSQASLNQAENAAIQRAKRTPEALVKAAKGGSKSMNRYDSEYQSKMGKKGGAIGARVAYQNQIEKYGEEGYRKLVKERIYESKTEKEKSEFHKKGAAKSHANRRAQLNIILENIFNDLPDTFTQPETEEIMIKYGKGKAYFNDVRRLMPDRFEIAVKGKKGHTHTIYRKIK